MTGRQAAIAEWVLAGILLVWFVFFAATQAENTLKLGIVISSLFFAPGLALSLTINGLIHRRRARLSIAEHVLLAIELVLIALMVVASALDQSPPPGPYAGFGIGWGHWLEWFVPLWALIGPIALTVLIVGIVKRAKPVAAAAAVPV